jgi:hypothetical protein
METVCPQAIERHRIAAVESYGFGFKVEHTYLLFLCGELGEIHHRHRGLGTGDRLRTAVKVRDVSGDWLAGIPLEDQIQLFLGD